MSELITSLPVEQLQRGRFQPRRQFDEGALEELAVSIAKNGIVQPIIVRPTGENQYEIVAGERRWRAAQRARQEVVPCIIKDYTEAQMAAVATIENINRVDLNPIEEAASYQRLIDEFRYTHDEISAIVGKSREKISNLLRLLNLDPNIQNLITGGHLREGHGKVLASLDPKAQYIFARQCVREQWSVNQLALEIKKSKQPESTQNQSPTTQKKSTEIKAFERALAEHLSTPVKLEASGNNEPGWLKIRFFDLQTLMGIVEKMGLKSEADLGAHR